ncbi:MAG: hypothetical protein Q9170_007792 [Blastenia crenularia]
MRRIDIWANQYDIEEYLEAEINTSNRLSKIIATYPKLKHEIISTVSTKAAGITIRENINALPTGVYATYAEDIGRIENQSEEDCRLAKRALSYIFTVRRPLSVEELRHALAIEAGDTEIDETAFPESETLLNVSAGLIRIDQKSKTIRLVHYTLQEYLEKNSGELLPDLEHMFATTCLTYLSLDVFSNGSCSGKEALDQRLQAYQFLDYASHNWGHHVVGNERIQELILNFLKDDHKLACSVQILHTTSRRTNGWQDHFPKQFGPLHVSAYWGLDNILAVLLGKGLDVNCQDSHGATALQIATKHGHESSVRLLLKNAASIHTENQNGQTALYWAARNGHNTIVRLLLMSGANVLIRDTEGWSALDWAVIGGKSNMVKDLLEHGVDAESDGRNKALYLAAENGHEDTVQMLLDNGADVNASDWIGSTALDWAVPGGHERTVRVLLQNGCNLKSRDAYENTALHWAVHHELIARLLIENGVDVNAQNDCGQTALCWVARDGPVAVAQLLIEHGANINIQDRCGCTALHGAALKGREAMLQLLLNQGANPNLIDNDGWTPLHAAAWKKHKDIVQVLLERVDNGKATLDLVALQQQDTRKRELSMDIAEKKSEGSTVITGLRAAVQERHMSRLQVLLEEGADVNAKDVGGWTALILAAENGYVEAVEMLLRNGADVDISGRRSWSALHWAASHGELMVVQLLVKNGANINANKNGWAPILLAAKKGYMAVVEFLTENGADANSEDYHGRRALHWAAEHGQTTMARLLLDNGANPNAIDRWGRTALLWAIENKQQEVALQLINIGTDLELKTLDGSTALHLAVFMRNEEIVQQLLKREADIGAKTRDQFTPIHVAALIWDGEMVQQLLDRGADVDAEAQWHGVRNNDDCEDAVADAIEVKSLSSHLRQLLLERRNAVGDAAEPQQMITARQLADTEKVESSTHHESFNSLSASKLEIDCMIASHQLKSPEQVLKPLAGLATENENLESRIFDSIIVPSPTLLEIETKLGYKVDSLTYPDKNTDCFYFDLRRIPQSNYWKIMQEFNEYERRTYRRDKRKCSEQVLGELDLVHPQTAAYDNDTVSLTRKTNVYFYNNTVEINLGCGFNLVLLVTDEEAFDTLSVAKLRQSTSGDSTPLLFRLPREIRDKIYDFALPKGNWQIEDVDDFNRCKFIRSIGDPSGFYFPLSSKVAALGVNRQMRQEALPFAYRKTLFHLDDMDDLVKLLVAVGKVGRDNIEMLELAWESRADSELKWDENPDMDDSSLLLPTLHAARCIHLLQQCKRLRSLRLYLEKDLIMDISLDDFKAHPGIRELCSLRGIKTVQICDLGHEPIDRHGLAKWLREKMESSTEEEE